MNRFSMAILLKALFVLPLAIWSLSFCNSVAAEDRPNIVMLFTDDQRLDGVGFMGNPAIQTPHLDSLAEKGVVFDQCFVNTSICAISRANLLLGQYPTQHGIDDFFKTPTPEQFEESVPGRLQKIGYETAFFGKWGIGDTVANTQLGTAVFDFWAGQPMQTCFFHNRDCKYVTSNGQPALCDCPADARGKTGFRNRIGTKGLTNPLHTDSEIVPMHVDRFLEGRSANKPFCMFVHFKSPHSPYQDWDPEFAHQTDGVEMPIPPAATLENAMREPLVIKNSLGRPSGMSLLKHPQRREAHMRDYYRLVSSMDKGVGKIVQNLKQRGLHDNTIYLFTSDNGHHITEHGLLGKWVMYEPSLRIPGFMFDARSPKNGDKIKPLVITTDFSVTMLTAAGLPAPAEMAGLDLTTLYHSEAPAEVEWRDDFFYDHPYRHDGSIPHSQGVRDSRYVYIRYVSENPVFEQLFDLQNDPDQLQNLVAKPELKEKLVQMRDRWQTFQDELQ